MEPFDLFLFVLIMKANGLHKTLGKVIVVLIERQIEIVAYLGSSPALSCFGSSRLLMTTNDFEDSFLLYILQSNCYPLMEKCALSLLHWEFAVGDQTSLLHLVRQWLATNDELNLALNLLLYDTAEMV